MQAEEHVTAVVVTHNRRDLLVESLTALQGQTRPPDATLVVDNASNDGTVEAVRQGFEGVQVVAMERNTGGAGGFAAGIAQALAREADLIWLLDDDAIAQPQALEALLDARERYPELPAPAVVASRVVWTDGRDHPMNTPRERPMVTGVERQAAAVAGCMPIRSASFVSVLIDAGVAGEEDLPLADYFLWGDDFEYTARLLRRRRGLYCPASVVVHKTRAFTDTDADPGERFFYEVRNRIWLYTRSRGLGPMERGLYAGSTLRRWVRTFAASNDRAQLWGCLRSGLAAAIRSGPRPTREILGELRPEVAPPDREVRRA